MANLAIIKSDFPTSSTSSSSTSDQSTNDGESSEESEKCCSTKETEQSISPTKPKASEKACKITIDNTSRSNNYATNKNMAEGLMDIALLSANANQLRFLITYNHDASTYYISMALVSLSLIMQIGVGIALIFKVSSILLSAL